MAKSSPSSTRPNFTGKDGRRRLVEVLKAQTLVGQNERLAALLVSNGELVEHQPDEIIIQQGAYDNDIYLLLSGQVAIVVNGRQVARRDAGTHVGELALADSLAQRSATVSAIGHTTSLRVSEQKFTHVACQFPELWRRIAVEVANRLKQRNTSIRTPRSEPVLFIGSSSEAIVVAEEIHRRMRSKPVVPKIWTTGVFEASKTSIESLVEFTRETDFALLILTPDDVTVSRRGSKSSPRDNVIFELGLFIGALGRDRVFMLTPKRTDVKIPSDLFGVTYLSYAHRGPKSLGERLKPAFTQLYRNISALGPI